MNDCHFCCSDISCICGAHSADTAATNLTTCSFAAAFCCRTMRNSDRPPTPDRKRRHTFANTRQPILRATTGAPQLQNKVTLNQLFVPSTGIRPRQSVVFTPGETTINGPLHRMLFCPDPPLVLEAQTQMWNPLHNAGCWEHGVPWTFGKDFATVVKSEEV